MYKLSGVTKDYQKGRDDCARAAWRGPGDPGQDWLAIQGPTGHGKSTLLQLLGGLDRPTAGWSTSTARTWPRCGRSQLTQVRATSIGFIFQTFNLIPTLSAQENVETALVPLGIHGRPQRPRASRRWPTSVSATGPGTCPSELSGGQQQRVAIARALVKEPKVLLADEPTGNLDEDTRDEIIGLLEKLWQEYGLTVVVVTHDSARPARPAARQMKNGKLTIKTKV